MKQKTVKRVIVVNISESNFIQLCKWQKNLHMFLIRKLKKKKLTIKFNKENYKIDFLTKHQINQSINYKSKKQQQ